MKILTLKSFAIASLALTLGACASFAGGYKENTAERLEAIHPGLTKDEVRSIAGRPGLASNSRAGASEWSYSFTDEWGYQAEYTVDFDASGKVVTALADRTR